MAHPASQQHVEVSCCQQCSKVQTPQHDQTGWGASDERWSSSIKGVFLVGELGALQVTKNHVAGSLNGLLLHFFGEQDALGVAGG